ncbi:MAG: zinc ribbon domain-containing protein [Actinobacteria bacterium]|nr:zinc ribbon domain-containing protein [Actinomycetota bacterium]
MNQEKKPDEIYCPSCARPIKNDAVVCPHCGVQVRELKVTAETQTLTPEQELEEGRRQLGGIKAWFWVAVVVLAIYLVVFIPIIATSPQVTGAILPAGNIALSITVLIFVFGIWIALYLIPLIGLIKRKSFSVPFTRAMLVITMLGFPIGTIIGAVLWKRINHPLAKKYLNYGT